MDDLLERSALELREQVAAELPDLPKVHKRARSIRRRRQAMELTALLVAAALLGTGTALLTRASRPQRRVFTATGDQLSPLPVQMVPGPTGWTPADWGDARLWVPPTWTLIGANTETCGPGSYVLLGSAGLLSSPCPPPAPAAVVHLGTLQPLNEPTTTTVINGYKVVAPLHQAPDHNLYSAPELGVSITASGAGTDAILATLGPSARRAVLAPGPTARVPGDWQSVTYGALRFRVPAAWPVVRNPMGRCGFPNVVADQVLLGDPGEPSCSAGIQPPPPADGLWVIDGAPQGPNGKPVGSPNGLPVYALPGEAWGNTLALYSDGMSIFLGLGPDPAIARTVLASFSSVGGEPAATITATAVSVTPPKQVPVPASVAVHLMTATGQPGQIVVLDTATGRTLRTLGAEYDPYLSNGFTLSGDRSAVIYTRLNEAAQKIEVVRVPLTGGPAVVLADGVSANASRDGKRLAYRPQGSATAIDVFDLQTLTARSMPPVPANGPALSGAWLPDNRTYLEVVYPQVLGGSSEGVSCPGGASCTAQSGTSAGAPTGWTIDTSAASPAWRPLSLQLPTGWSDVNVLGPGRLPGTVAAWRNTGPYQDFPVPLIVTIGLDGRVIDNVPASGVDQILGVDASGTNFLATTGNGLEWCSFAHPAPTKLSGAVAEAAW